ncbi:hypothetical protein F4680DRAFT_447887 [Xylaria scruposa]|nr:hypothetical protein F4680DRAFT_447887 [Xylaria scruposa]
MTSEPMSLDRTPTPDSDVHFHQFSKLPLELRDMVWDEALLVEALNRMVFVDTETCAIYPTRHLVSKIMQVCYASNRRAKAIYNYREAVYEVLLRDMLPSESEDHDFDEFKLGDEVGAVYLSFPIPLSPQHDTFCVGIFWPPVGICPYHDCMRTVSYYSTKAMDEDDPLLLDVLKVCSFDKYKLDIFGHFKGEGMPEYSTLTPSEQPDLHITMFPNVGHWSVIFYPFLINIALPSEIGNPILTTDVQVIANEGWEGQCRLMNEAPFKYAVASLRGRNPPSVFFLPLSLLGRFLNT